jgi:ephrin-B
VPNTVSTTSVKDWLDEIKMSSYMPHFATAGYESLSDLAGLMDNDLKELGISLVGHRNKMLRTIRSLPITKE